MEFGDTVVEAEANAVIDTVAEMRGELDTLTDTVILRVPTSTLAETVDDNVRVIVFKPETETLGVDDPEREIAALTETDTVPDCDRELRVLAELLAVLKLLTVRNGALTVVNGLTVCDEDSKQNANKNKDVNAWP